ncbi:ciliogenesis and planar polarity effector 2 [Oryzias melastigma]|uniref:ciliogenesis and planar polarity effector 2 n=1 Tax=Oryzias melastigma TaxID=30732 RepID=UPI000CF7FEF9|nr:ciliogenesis and planar polarity effector 2 [Oryzias melastigma]
MIPPGSVIIADWHLCKESKEFFQKILHKKGRKKFGLLESPVMPPHVSVETVHYKVFLSGKSGVGKTTLAARLAGLNLPSVHHETTGIETTVVYWPVRLRDGGRVLFFRLQLWDCGENALRRFDHLLPSCREQADAVLFLFSFIDRTSFDDLSNQTAKWSDPSVVKVVIGTKFDLFMHCDVSERDVKEFQERWNLPVLRTGGEVTDGLGDVAPILNCLAENLWHQDCLMRTVQPSQQDCVTVL